MAQLIPVHTFDLMIFGGTGDLAMRKLLPAMYHRCRAQKLYRRFIGEWIRQIPEQYDCGTFAGVGPASLCTVLQCCPWTPPD